VVNIAAAKKVTLAVSGGASITIEGGSVTVQCPGKITVKAGQKSMVGPGTMSHKMPQFPDATLSPYKRHASFSLGALPGAMQNYAGEPYTLYADGAVLQQGLADDEGSVMWEHKDGTSHYKIELASGHVFEVAALEAFANPAADHLANAGFRSFTSESPDKTEHGAEGDAFRKRVSRKSNKA
jgi:type VI secretion system secreted protein VgrG